jgi:inosine-uridine nucleoside N-ribohydrolase
VQDADLNLDWLLNWLDRGTIPRGLGAEKPLIEDTAWFESWQSAYGKTLPWKVRPSAYLAANLIIDLVHTHARQISILSLGSMTNLALATRLDPSIIPLAWEVIVMGGSFNNQDHAPEFNVRCDPEAAQIVFSAGWNVNILGLDITRRVHFSRRDFSSLSDGNPAVELLRAQAPGWIDRVEKMGWVQDGCSLHDAVAAAYLVDDTLFQTQQTEVAIELQDQHSRGLIRFSSATDNRRIVNVITGLDAVKCRDLIWSHIQ